MAASGRIQGWGRRGSLIVSLVVALAAVAALPLGLMAYQISLSRESMVEQAQRTHLIAARATADRLEAALSALVAAADGAAQNPQLFDAPRSTAAGEVLAGLLVGETRLRAAALFHSEAGREVLVQMARAPNAASLQAQALAGLGTNVLLQREGDDLLWGLSRDTARPGLRLAVLADAADLDAMLQPRELGPSAQLVLLQDASPHPARPVETALPESLLQALAQRELDALAVRADGDAGIEVSAFARVAGTDWSIASLQPAEEAEAAAARMRQGAFAASVVVLALIALLSLFAWRRVVRPVRALLDWQRSALSAEASGGSDLSNLREAFEQIQRNQRNREALGEVFVGRYRLLSTLGQGAMGSVFLAWDPRLKRHVAIKTLHLEALDARQQASLAQALEAEAIKIAKLQHPNIVGVHDLVAAGEFVFVVMEYVEGGNLRSLIDHHGALDPAEVVLIARAVLGALHVAHRSGLLHLDIKPSNLLVSPEGEIKLADFGVSAWRSELPELLTREGAAGTPGFIAPEYVSGAQPSERSDLFSLGVVLVECMTGVRQSLPGARSSDLLRVARLRRAPPAGSRRDIVALWMAVQALCHADPELRPGSAAAALEMFAQMDTAGAAQGLVERIAAIGARAAILPGDASTRARDFATTQPLPVVKTPVLADAAPAPTTPQAWAEVTQPQPWAEATQPQPWAEATQSQPWAASTRRQPWAASEPLQPSLDAGAFSVSSEAVSALSPDAVPDPQATRLQSWAEETRVQPWAALDQAGSDVSGRAEAHADSGAADAGEESTQPARYRPSAGPDGSTAPLLRGDLSALDDTTRPAQRRPEPPNSMLPTSNRTDPA